MGTVKKGGAGAFLMLGSGWVGSRRLACMQGRSIPQTAHPHARIHINNQALWRLLLPTIPSRRMHRRQQPAQEEESLTYTSFSTSVEGWGDEDEGEEEEEEEGWDLEVEIEEWEEEDDSLGFYAFDRAAAEAEFFGVDWLVVGQQEQLQRKEEGAAATATVASDANTCVAADGGSCGVEQEEEEERDAVAALLARSALGRVIARVGGK